MAAPFSWCNIPPDGSFPGFPPFFPGSSLMYPAPHYPGYPYGTPAIPHPMNHIPSNHMRHNLHFIGQQPQQQTHEEESKPKLKSPKLDTEDETYPTKEQEITPEKHHKRSRQDSFNVSHETESDESINSDKSDGKDRSDSSKQDSGSKYPEYCQTLTVRDSSGHVKELVFPKALDLDRPKRARTTFAPEQLMALEQEFNRNQYLVGRERTGLAKRLGLSETQVKVWYQNRRTKHKRDQSREVEGEKARAESNAACNILKLLQDRRAGPGQTGVPPQERPPGMSQPVLIQGGSTNDRLAMPPGGLIPGMPYPRTFMPEMTSPRNMTSHRDMTSYSSGPGHLRNSSGPRLDISPT